MARTKRTTGKQTAATAVVPSPAASMSPGAERANLIVSVLYALPNWGPQNDEMRKLAAYLEVPFVLILLARDLGMDDPSLSIEDVTAFTEWMQREQVTRDIFAFTAPTTAEV